MKVLELARKEDSGTDEIARTLTSDPVLASKVLRMVNSSSYSLRFEVLTVKHAISLLGLVTVQTLALSFSLAPPSRADFAMKRFWKRSAIAAVAARELARCVELPPEEGFLAGLLQDIGILALRQIGSPEFRNVAHRTHRALRDAELAEFGCDHAEVGAWLAQRWRLGPKYVTAIAQSHEVQDFSSEHGPDAERFVRLVALSGHIADLWVDEERCLRVDEACAMAEKHLGFDRPQFEAQLANVAAQLPEVSKFLDVELGDRDETDAVLDAARDALEDLSLRTAVAAEAAKQTIGVLEARTAVLQGEARTDKLTGVSNRNWLDCYLEEALASARRDGQPLSVILVDLDHFKVINDTHGHLTGDSVLVSTASNLQSGVRPRDLVGRWGGEEFLVVLPNTNEEGAVIVAERLRTRISSSEVHSSEVQGPEGAALLRVTASFGCATLAGDTTAAVLIGRADVALYQAKRSGRNRVISAVSCHPRSDTAQV